MTKSEDSLQSLLSQLREEPLPELDSEEDAAREERFAGHIDEIVAQLPVEEAPRRSRRGLAFLLLAACLSVGVVAIALKRGPGGVAIESEPLTARRGNEISEPEAAPSARTVIPKTQVGTDSRPLQRPKPETPSSRPKLERESPAVPSPTQAETVSSAGATGETGAVTTSTLSEENRLFQAASQAEQAGDIGGAVSTLDKLVRDFPRSPLAQNAMARKFRLLSRAGRKGEAMDEARRYLRTYPSGFAEREAATILSERPEQPAQPPVSPPSSNPSKPGTRD